MKQVELSLCVIARDEEARLPDCLRSIAPFVDEMIVVDTGSKDRTREVAHKCGARVFEFTWTDSFAEARNQSLNQARGQYIFWMDADDVILPECGRQLRELVRNHPNRDAAYQVQVRIPPGPTEHSVTVVDHVKLFPNRPDLRFEHRIHEQVLPSLRRAGIEVRFSDLYVTHQNYDRSPEGQARKRARDFRLLELDLIDHPDHPFVLFNLGMTHLYATRDYEVAVQYLHRCLERSDWRDSIVRKAYAMLTTARVCQSEWIAAITANEEGRKHYPEDAELLFLAGQIYQQIGRFDEARSALERLVTGRDDSHYRSVDMSLRTFRGQHELALFFRRTGDAPRCERILRDIVASYPDYMPASIDLAETLVGMGREAETRNLAQRTIHQSVPSTPLDPGAAKPSNSSDQTDPARSFVGLPMADPTEGTLTDCLQRAIIQPTGRHLRSDRCIATVVSPHYSHLLDDMLGSLYANGNCSGALVIVFMVDPDAECARVVAKYGATGISCRAQSTHNPTLKSILYSVARIVEARQYLCLDADMLILDDLSSIFAALDACNEQSILICRDSGITSPTLGQALCGFYAGRLEDIDLLVGESTGKAAYPLVVNDGLFAGSRQALLALDETLRSMAPNAIPWMDGFQRHGCRNQFLLNLALAKRNCGVQLDDRYNLQLNERDVVLSDDRGRMEARFEGRSVHVLHFCGPGRGKYSAWRGRR